ncbi:MAG: CYTH domain-containing protein [Lachnospiraceae bacterium]|nr:CYTH domain-containing protein [Lachnospiraceae bacterium]
MEIERKFLIKEMPDLTKYPFKKMEQGYLNTSPTVRVRRENEEYFLTYKSKSIDGISREEYNLPLTQEAYEHLIRKCDGNIITKTRYLIPIKDLGNDHDSLTAELDVFEARFNGLTFVEVEFETVEKANAFIKPEWFGEDVTDKKEYYNSYLSQLV